MLEAFCFSIPLVRVRRLEDFGGKRAIDDRANFLQGSRGTGRKDLDSNIAERGGFGAAGGSSSALGPPQGSTLFYTIWLYQQGFEGFHLGYASAMAWMLFVIVMACTLVLIKSSNRWVFYQGGFR